MLCLKYFQPPTPKSTRNPIFRPSISREILPAGYIIVATYMLISLYLMVHCCVKAADHSQLLCIVFRKL